MDRLYFVSYGERVTCGLEDSGWDFHEVVIETHPMVWMAKKRAEEAAWVQPFVERREIIPMSLFRLLSWQKLEGDEVTYVRMLIAQGQQFPTEEGL